MDIRYEKRRRQSKDHPARRLEDAAQAAEQAIVSADRVWREGLMTRQAICEQLDNMIGSSGDP